MLIILAVTFQLKSSDRIDCDLRNRQQSSHDLFVIKFASPLVAGDVTRSLSQRKLSCPVLAGCSHRDRTQLPSSLPSFTWSELGCFSASKTTTKSLTLMLTVISEESNFPYFDGSIFYNFTIVCFALLRLRASSSGVMKQRKLTAAAGC